MAKDKDGKQSDGVVASNRRAFHDYFVDDRYEAGLVLEGCEVKSLRAHHVSIQESYATVANGEVWVHGMRISPYAPARDNPDPTRDRKLLLKRQEIRKLERAVREKGYTLIPLKIYFTARGLAKLQLGLCRGKRQFDKREAIAEREFKVRTERALSERERGRSR
ncbi:MAG: SsrA-binding protein SmpB [Armatimonadetes bacterium]|jgi:SsrA-binding protein|nr:SsrA-binding protein SmpB [Armatimonadota bacterium]MDI9585050.1 SsrA-binding protein SmpB [Acidobacteriota bacterium]